VNNQKCFLGETPKKDAEGAFGASFKGASEVAEKKAPEAPREPLKSRTKPREPLRDSGL
jgi:hypothetical protein